MLYKYGKRKRDFLGRFIFYLVFFAILWGVFNKTIIPLALVEYEMIIANSALRASLAMIISYPTRARGIIQRPLISNARLWNNC